MSKIHLENYEAFLLDYAEGQLSAEDTADLLLFLEQHPNLQIDIESLDLSILEPSDAEIGHWKDSMKKSTDDVRLRFESLCIAFYDKQINEAEKKELDHLIRQFPAWESDFKAFAYAYLSVDPALVFENKDLLRKVFIGDSSFDDLATKALEGQLNETGNVELQRLVKSDAQLAYAWKAFQATILIPETLEFQHKSDLYRKDDRKVIAFWIKGLAAAAGLALIIGIGSFLRESNPEQGIALSRQDSIPAVRRVVMPNEAPEKVDASTSDQQTPQRQKQQIISPVKPSQLANEEPTPSLDPQPMSPIEVFELPEEYLASSPSNMQTYDDYANNMQSEPQFLSNRQVIWKRVTKILKKKEIDIQTPIDDIRENGLAELGIRSIERVSRGAVSIDREINGSSRKIIGVHVLGLGYSRSTQ